MLGGGSFQLAKIHGVRVGVNGSWFVVLFLFILWLKPSFEDDLGSSTEGFVAAAASALLFFGSILLHELGHAFAARREGIGVRGIELFFFGGVMSMDGDARTPGQEFRVAVAGPLVTLLIVLVTAGITLLARGSGGFTDAVTLSGSGALAGEVIAFMASANLVLLVFNLIPAFPLDGGRIFRAAAWRVTGDRLKGTRAAAFLGRGFAGVLMLYGVYQLVRGDSFGGLWSLVLGWMLGGAARAALAQTAVTERLEGVTVADVMDADPVTIPAELPAARAYEDYFLRYQGWPWFAVIEEDGRFAGLALRERVRDAPADVPVRQVADDGDEVRTDTSLEALLGSEPLRRNGALMAVDAEGRLRGVVTLEQVTRALQSRLAPTPS